MKIINTLKTLLKNLLTFRKKTSNFEKQNARERKAYVNLIMQQSVLLDEHEDLLKAYEDALEDSNGSTNSDTVRNTKPSS